MTEDDTFEALKRLPFEVVRAAWINELRTRPPLEIDVEKFFISRGWTPDEYTATYKEKYD